MTSLLLVLSLFGQTFEVQGTDDVAINAAITKAVAAGGGVVKIPGGRYTLEAPINLRDCYGVTLRGDGPSTIIGSNGYCGYVIAVGLPCASVSPDHRVRGLKESVATLGTHALAITGHPLQLGWTSPGRQPDYWAGTAPITWDFALGPEDGKDAADWNQWAPLVGFGDSWGNPAPWLIRWADGGLVLDMRMQGDAQFHRVAIPVDVNARVWRVSIQYDPATGRIAVWVNGRLVATTWVPGWGTVRPGPLVAHDGVTPLMIGYAGQAMDGLSFGGITAVVVHGLRVCRSAVWQWDGKNPGQQTFTVQPDLAINDDTQFFSSADQVIPAGSLVGFLPMDKEEDGYPWVSCISHRGRGLFAWLTPITTLAVGTNRVAIEDMTLAGAEQTTILLGRHSEVNVRRVVSSGASQAVGSMPLMYSYPLNLTDCDINGWDAPIVSWNQMISARNLMMSGVGRHGIRTIGGTGLWDDVKVWRLSSYCESVFQHTGADDGLSQEYRHVLVDNEDYDPTVAFLNVVEGYVQRGSIAVNGMAVSSGSPIIRMVGGGTSAPYRLDAKGLTSFGLSPVGLSVEGPVPWVHGSVDVSQLYPGAVEGNVSQIKVTGPTPLYVAPAVPQ